MPRSLRAVVAILALAFLLVGMSGAIGVGQAAAATTSAVPATCAHKPGKVICISKKSKRLFALNNGRVVWAKALNQLGVITVRVGAEKKGETASDGEKPPATATREGTFRIFGKKKDTYSNIYKNARMRYFMKFSGGQGIHYSYEYARNGYPYSHGCVGLKSLKFAKWLYGWAPMGTVVIVTRR